VVVCLAQLMIVLDTTIVNVALPSIQRDSTHPGQPHLGHRRLPRHLRSFLLLAGRLGTDRRSEYSSPASSCSRGVGALRLAPVRLLIAARFLQGIGAAMQPP